MIMDFRSSQVRTTLILLYHKLLKKCNTFNPIICRSKKKTNLFCFLTTFFKTGRFERENEMRRKALTHTRKILESSPFGNPESSTRNTESTVWNPESKTLLDSLTWGDVVILLLIAIMFMKINFKNMKHCQQIRVRLSELL